MIQSRNLIALGIFGTLFFLTGVNIFSDAQISSDASMGGNMTNATMPTKTSGINLTGMNETTNATMPTKTSGINFTG
jgi:hypothetical protein